MGFDKPRTIKNILISSAPLRSITSPARRVYRWWVKSRSNRFHQIYADIFSNAVAGSLVLKIPEFEGTFELDIRSDILRSALQHKTYEPELAAIVRKHVCPGTDVIDVGANGGLYTILFAKLLGETGRVLSIEPTPVALKYLQNNLERNDCRTNVLVYQGVASSLDGEYDLNIIPGKEEYSSLGNLTHPAISNEHTEKIRVPGKKIDSLVGENSLRPGFIKIDAEGAELQVLMGARQTLISHRPKLLMELSEGLLNQCGATKQQVFEMLDQLGYRIVYLVDHGFYSDVFAVSSE
jgi:FkbM family methyltransferase